MLEKKIGLNFCVSFCEKHVLKFFNSLHRTQVNIVSNSGLSIEAVHFPPGTSKWNKIEHRLFSYVSKKWMDRPLISYQVIVSLIANTTPTKGLKEDCKIDDKQYKTGIEVTDEQWVELNICQNEFHGE